MCVGSQIFVTLTQNQELSVWWSLDEIYFALVGRWVVGRARSLAPLCFRSGPWLSVLQYNVNSGSRVTSPFFFFSVKLINSRCFGGSFFNQVPAWDIRRNSLRAIAVGIWCQCWRSSSTASLRFTVSRTMSDGKVQGKKKISKKII